MDNKTKKVIKFEEVKELISSAVKKKIEEKELIIDEDVSIVEGFSNQYLQKEITSNIVLGGEVQFVPMIMLVGNKSGLIYFVALKALLPNIELP